MTLNQAITKLTKIVLGHAQVNSFYFGDISEWSEFAGLSYTSCLLTLNDAVVKDKTTEVNFTFWIADRLANDYSNRTDIFSDTVQILNDLLSGVNDIDIPWLPRLNERPVVFFEDMRGNDNADKVAGVKFDFSIELYEQRDRCAVPARVRNFIKTEAGFYILTEDEGSPISTES